MRIGCIGHPKTYCRGETQFSARIRVHKVVNVWGHKHSVVLVWGVVVHENNFIRFAAKTTSIRCNMYVKIVKSLNSQYEVTLTAASWASERAILIRATVRVESSSMFTFRKASEARSSFREEPASWNRACRAASWQTCTAIVVFYI